MKKNSTGNTTTTNQAVTGNRKVLDLKLQSEDYKKYEDKTAKKIKDGKQYFVKFKTGSRKWEKLLKLIYLQICQCKSYGEITLDEYTKGLTSFGANNLLEVKHYIIIVKEDLLNIFSEDFKKFYYFLFTFNLVKKSNKVLDFEVYKLYFVELFDHQFKLVNEFLEFMVKEKKSVQIKEDQWNLFLELLKVFGDQFPKNYNVEESWPTLFDEFYIWYCKKYDIKIDAPAYD